MTKQLNGMYIGGAWVGTGQTFSDLNPANDSVWAEVPDGGIAEVRRAIDAAQGAFSEWAALPFSHRTHYLLKVADVLEKRIPDVAKALQGEGGGAFGKGMFEAGYIPEVFRAAAAGCYDAIGEVLPSEHGKFSTAVRRPMGVISVISPWNFPCLLSARGFAFPLAAGNTIVLKPSEDTPLLRRPVVCRGLPGSGCSRRCTECSDLFARQRGERRGRTGGESVGKGDLVYRLDTRGEADRRQGGCAP